MVRTHDLIVIGAGAAGLTAAGGAAQLGLRVALIERDRMGGECLSTGCVPSKALIAIARRAHAMRSADSFGIKLVEPEIDFQAVHAKVHEAIAAIAPHDSEERFRNFGVEIFRGSACFVGGQTVEVNDRRLNAPRIVIAVGSKPSVPPIDGLASTPYLTNESLFDLSDRPRHLVILGGGPIGMEMAQAFRRLGSQVTVIEADRPLGRDDPEAAAVVVQQLAAEGVVLHSGVRAVGATRTADGIAVSMSEGASISGSHLLVALGRTPAIEGLGLDRAGVKVSEGAIVVDAGRRTSNHRIYAIGDCRAGPRFTHVSGYEGEIVVRNICFGIPAKVDFSHLPRVTYTDPEIAQLGLTEAEARERHGVIEVSREPFADNDRAVTEGAPTGFIKIIRARRKLIGVTMLGSNVGELALPWTLVMGREASLWSLAGAMVAYPTRSEISKAVSFLAYRDIVFGTWARRWVQLRSRFLH